MSALYIEPGNRWEGGRRVTDRAAAQVTRVTARRADFAGSAGAGRDGDKVLRSGRGGPGRGGAGREGRG